VKEAQPKVLLITGGTGSIGSELAIQALTLNWKVVIQGSHGSTVDVLVSELQFRFGKSNIAGVVADIKIEGAIEQFVREAAAQFGRIDAIADCLVTGPDQGRIAGPFENIDSEAYLPFAELSIVYLERLVFFALPFLKQSRGALTALVSDAGLFPAPRQSLIGAARAGAIGFIKNIALEIACSGVRANCISLSYVEDTKSFEKLNAQGFDRIEKARKRAGLGLPTPEDITPLILFLCGDGAKRLTGQVISINGGLNA